MTLEGILKGFGSDTEVLNTEREGLEDAMAKATRERKPQEVEIDGEKYIVTDDNCGRQVRRT